MPDQYLSTDPNAGEPVDDYLSLDPSEGEPVPAASLPPMQPLASHAQVPPADARRALAVQEAQAFVRQPLGPNYGSARDVFGGLASAGANVAFQGGDILRRLTGMERVVGTPEAQSAMTPPQTPAGSVGRFIGDAGMFVSPLSHVSKAMQGASIGRRMLADAATSGGVAALQTGADPGQTVAGAGLGAAVPIAGVALRTAQRAAAGAREGGVGGAVAGAIRTAAPAPPKEMLIQALKPRAVNRRFAQSLDTAIPELKVTEEALGRPIGGVEDLLEATTIAKRRVYGQLNQLRANAEGFQVDLNPVADAMERSIPKKLQLEHPDAALKMQNAATVYRQPFSLEDAEQLLKETNAEMESFYSKYPPSQRRALLADPELARLNAQAQALRTAIDAGLDRAVAGQGAAARELRRRYGSLLDVETEAHRRANVARRQQPESLSEQLSSARAAGDIARGAWRLLRGDLTGAADIASGVAMRDTATFLKEQQTADALVRRAFAGFSGSPSPVAIPPRRPVRGALPPGPVVTPPPADPSFVRGVPAQPALSGRPRQLPPGRTVRPMPGHVQEPSADPSRVGSVRAQPIDYAIDPTVSVKAGGFRVAQFSGDPEAARAAVASPDVQQMLRLMSDDLDTFTPQRGRMVSGRNIPGMTEAEGHYVPGVAGSPVGDDIRVISEQNVGNAAIKKAIRDLLQGKTPTNRLHTAALDAAMGYIEKRPGYRGPAISAEWGSGADEGFETFSRAVDDLSK